MRRADGIDRLRYLRRAILRRERAQRRALRWRKPWRSGLRTVCGVAAATTFVGALQLGIQATALPAIPEHPALAAPRFIPAEAQPGAIWKVEQRGVFASYSNGLQVRTDYQTDTEPRAYVVYSRRDLKPSAPRSTPAGIVFHTTESLQLPLESGETSSLLRAREGAVSYIRKNRLYNFFIDRFGQVFSVVPDGMRANHAGNSVWADGDVIYEGLNDSFLGVAFEAQTENARASEAQIVSGRLLTALLRSEYGIPDGNCVTHAQVSVNPSNMHLGFHIDWGAEFPFAAMGLHSGYQSSVAAVEIFGFEYDRHFLDSLGGHPWPGLSEAAGHFQRAAVARGLSAEAYRRSLQAAYQTIRSHTHEIRNHGAARTAGASPDTHDDPGNPRT